MSGATKARRGTLAKWALGLSEAEAAETLANSLARIKELAAGRRKQLEEASYLQARVSALRRRLRTIKQQGNHTGPRGKGSHE